VDAEASADTWSGEVPEFGVKVSWAAGGASPSGEELTVTWVVALDEFPAVSVAVIVTV
jgi:hypothetical protein